MFTLADTLGVLAAAALCIPLLVLPGYAIGTAVNALGLRREQGWMRVAIAALLGLTVLPGPLAFLSSVFGLGAAAALLVGMAAWGAVAVATDGVPTLSRTAKISAAVLLTCVTAVWIDIEFNGHLYQSILIVDMIKHAAVTRNIVEAGGTPFADPFIARDGAAAFYYFHFIVPAIIEWGTRGWIDPRAAVGGQAYWTAIALFGLALLLYRRSGLRGADRIGPLIAALLVTSGLQMCFVFLFNVAQSAGGANTQITPWPLVVTYVPHHLAAFLASWVAMLLLIDAADQKSLRGRGLHVVLAGAALASTPGLSVWVAMGLVLSVALWSVVLVAQRRLADVARIAAAGVVSLLIAAPYLLQLMNLRHAGGPSPVAVEARMFIFADTLADRVQAAYGPALHGWFNLISMPANYLLEFGVVAIGGLLFWLHPAFRNKPHNDVATLLWVTTAAAFLIGSFVKSAISNNDLGWRVMMFASLPLLLWTAHVFYPSIRRRALTPIDIASRMPLLPRLAMLLGLVVVLYDVTMLRVALTLPSVARGEDGRDLAVEHDLRHAYNWLNANVPRTLVTQHNPQPVRAFAPALYGRNPVGVADQHNPFLLGADPNLVRARLADLQPLFKSPFTGKHVQDAAKRHGVDLLVVTAADPVWATGVAWLDGPAVIHARDKVRILRVDRLTVPRTTAELQP